MDNNLYLRVPRHYYNTLGNGYQQQYENLPDAKCDLIQVKDKRLMNDIIRKEIFFEEHGIHKKGINKVFRYGKDYIVDNSKRKVEVYEIKEK